MDDKRAEEIRVKSNVDVAAGEMKVAAQERATIIEEHNSIAAVVTEIDKQISQCIEEYNKADKDILRIDGEVTAIDKRLADILVALAEREDDEQRTISAITEKRKEVEQSEAEREQLHRKKNTLDDMYSERERLVEEAKAFQHKEKIAWEQATKETGQIRNKFLDASTRLEALQAMLNAHEGVSSDVKDLAAFKIPGTLADI